MEVLGQGMGLCQKGSSQSTEDAIVACSLHKMSSGLPYFLCSWRDGSKDVPFSFNKSWATLVLSPGWLTL